MSFARDSGGQQQQPQQNENPRQQQEAESNFTMPTAGQNDQLSNNEGSYLFSAQNRTRNPNSLSPEHAFAHMVKAMLGTGLLSLPYAFKHSGLYLGIILLLVITFVCLYCMRQIVFASHFICAKYGRELVDYANIMRGAVELGPSWIATRGYFFKQLVNVTMFLAQLGFCCVYFVFMSENLKSFFDQNTSIYLSKGVWMLVILVPILLVCLIRNLRVLAPFSFAANIVYLCAVAIVTYYFFTHLQPSSELVKFGSLTDLPMFFGTVMFAFEGVSVVMPIESRMERPHQFIAWHGVLNTSCFTILVIFAITGFYGYLSIGDAVHDTVTTNLPHVFFYDALKLMFVFCVMVSYPIQFYVPMERIEKYITRKCPVHHQTRNIYAARVSMVVLTCAIAELVPYLALFISLVGAIACTSLGLLFPPFIDLLVNYAQNTLSPSVWFRNTTIFCFAFLGFTTGTYSALYQIVQKFRS